MKRFYSLFTLLFFLSGCVSAGITPPKDATGKLREIYIVAMETHPLGVPPSFNSVILGSGGSITTARGFALFNTVAILLELPEVSKRGEETSRSYQTVLDQNGTWVPTVVLANEAQALLAAQGLRATIAPRVKPIPGVENRTYTVLMENWLAPIRAWYNDTTPVPDYRDISHDPSSFVIEVGVINYEIEPAGGLLVQVAMKVIDPSSGNVIGRARAANAWDMPQLNPLDQAFSGDASRFKESFLKTGQEITRKCLTELGLAQNTPQ